jgi:hypothetical protein
MTPADDEEGAARRALAASGWLAPLSTAREEPFRIIDGSKKRNIVSMASWLGIAPMSSLGSS